MAPNDGGASLRAGVFHFDNGGNAPYVVHDGGPVERSLEALNIPRDRPVVVVIGGARLHPDVVTRLEAVFFEAIGPAIVNCRATVITGGTRAGVMEITGKALRRSSTEPCVIGIAPVGRLDAELNSAPERPSETAAPDPHHSHFVLSPGEEWGDETTLMFETATAIRGDAPALIVLAGGGANAAKELRQLMPLHWPHLVVTGSGGLADSLDDDNSLIPLPHVERYPVDGELDVLRRLVAWRLSAADGLKELWHQFAVVDRAATNHRRLAQQLHRLQLAGLALLVAAAVVAGLIGPERTFFPAATGGGALIVGIILVRPRSDPRWMRARLEAERIRSTIFRTRVGLTAADDLDNAQQLATSVGSVLSAGIAPAIAKPRMTAPPRLLENQVDLRDTLVDDLDLEAYVRARIDHQLRYFEAAVDQRRSVTRMWIIAAIALGLVFAGLGILTSVDRFAWPALSGVLVMISVAIAAAVRKHRERINYTAAAARLRILRMRAPDLGLVTLARETEELLSAELKSWHDNVVQAFRIAMIDPSSGPG